MIIEKIRFAYYSWIGFTLGISSLLSGFYGHWTINPLGGFHFDKSSIFHLFLVTLGAVILLVSNHFLQHPIQLKKEKKKFQ